MSHFTVYVVTPSSPTLEQLDGLMRPYHEGGTETMDGQTWDYFVVRGWGRVAELLLAPDATRGAWGVIARGRGFMRMGRVEPATLKAYQQTLAVSGLELRYVEVDCHT